MKAIAIDRFGGPEQLIKRGFPKPEPLADEVLIQVVAAGISRLDASSCRGDARGSIAVAFPWIPGFEIAGVVERLGPECRRFRVGDRVCALLPAGGGYAQFATVQESRVAPMPASLLFEEAAALPLDGFAAWQALFSGADPITGSGSVIIRGASSGAGHLAVQIALAAGARVFVEAPEEHREFLKKLGRVEWLDGPDEPPAARRIDASTSGTCADGWIDLGGRDESEQVAALRSDQPHEIVAGLSSMIEQRRVRPRLFKILDIGQAVEAHQQVESRSTCGKLALTL
jgi:NADPH:quinone reductase-like Zn-dependent oxidoreductase